MKKMTRLLLCAAFVAGATTQVASAGILFTNRVKNIQARNVRTTLAASTLVSSGETYSFTAGAIRNQYTLAAGGQTGKAWIQFDLSNTWALYGQSNLTSASLWLWNQNGTGRAFWVAGIADGAGLEGWDQNTLTWSNAPANDYFTPASVGYAFVYSQCYGGTNIWEAPSSPAQGIDVSTTTVGQGALYISTNSSSKVTQFLKTDTDGKVTMAISDGPANLNQTIPIGTNGVYASDPLAANGLPTRDSPTLVMVFDVRVALTGGGAVCPGDPGVNVSMFGTDAGFDYLLYTNGIYSKTVSGTGSAVGFGLQNVTATYTAVASNTTTTVVAPVPGTVTVTVPPSPSFAVQPTSVVAATNSIITYAVTAVGAGGGYQWYRNGVALTDDGHYSGTAAARLIISPVLASDAATAANGYYVRIQNLCGAATFSTTNALTVQVARNLVWNGTPTNAWDVATTANWWLNTAGGTGTTFNSGDNVTLDQNGVTSLMLASPYLSPGVITFNGNAVTGVGGSGNISGPNSSLFVGGSLSSQLVITNANDFAGGTIISNGWLILRNNFSVGTNTITLAGTGVSVLEVVPTGSASSGIGGLNVTADGVLQVDGNSAFSAVILGPITGNSGRTLTVSAPNITSGNNIRCYGNFTCDNNIVLNLNGANWASYQSGNAIYNGVLSGNAILYPRGGTTILSGSNTFTQTIISQGNVGVGIDSDLANGYSPLGLGTFTQDNQGDNGILSWGGAHTVENPFTWLYRDNANRAFTTLGTNQLTMTGTFELSGGTNNLIRTFNIGNTAPTILSGVISDSGQNMGINKTGVGALYLNNGGNSYGGTTMVSAGRLAGSGNIPGALVVTNGAIGGGSAAAIGTLAVGGNATFSGNGGGFFRVNRSGSLSDKVAVGGTLANTGTGIISITNLGAVLQAGDAFTLFNKAMSGGNTLTVTGGGVTWTNRLAVDGTIVAGSAVAPQSPVITSTAVSGGNIVISGTNGTVGNAFVVLSSTNLTTPRAAWTLESSGTFGAGGSFSISLPVSAATQIKFYLLSLP